MSDGWIGERRLENTHARKTTVAQHMVSLRVSLRLTHSLFKGGQTKIKRLRDSESRNYADKK